MSRPPLTAEQRRMLLDASVPVLGLADPQDFVVVPGATTLSGRLYVWRFEYRPEPLEPPDYQVNSFVRRVALAHAPEGIAAYLAWEARKELMARTVDDEVPEGAAERGEIDLGQVSADHLARFPPEEPTSIQIDEQQVPALRINAGGRGVAWADLPALDIALVMLTRGDEPALRTVELP